MNAWLNAVVQNDPELRVAGSRQTLRISQRSGLATPIVNPSPLGGKELRRLDDVSHRWKPVPLLDHRAGDRPKTVVSLKCCQAALVTTKG
jgi:hypothetical protein